MSKLTILVSAAAATLAGGYAARVEDTVTIHCNTAKAAAQALDAEQKTREKR